MNKETTIFIDTEDMEERYAEGLYMDYLEEQNKQLQNNWNELKEWAKTEYYDGCIYSSTIIKKMQEIEGGVDNE